ncbi:MAG: cytochrome c [Acidobacteriaceae bacterium]|nr:cytochrome c [Acidobacteriaceae bacterium]
MARGLLCLLVAATIVWAGARASLVQRASHRATEKRNPFESSDPARRAGAKLYARECAACHGEDREGRKGVPPLKQPEVFQTSPGTLFWILRNGDMFHGMPSFAHVPDAQKWQIITYLQGKPGQ